MQYPTAGSGYSSGYRYQSLWDCIGARKQSATDAKHYNLWNHIGDKTSYTTKLQTISWPSSPSSNPIPTIGTKADSLSTLKTTVWGGIENLRSQINALYNGLKNACTYIKGYVDNKANGLRKYVDDEIAKLKSYLNSVSYHGSPNYHKYVDLTALFKDNTPRGTGTYVTEYDGWLYIETPYNSGGSELQVKALGQADFVSISYITSNYGDGSQEGPYLLPFMRGDTIKIVPRGGWAWEGAGTNSHIFRYYGKR